MDPNNQQPAQQPGWGAPPPPAQQPGWGAPPPPPQQPGWGAPPPQPGWGAPAPGQPAWGAVPPKKGGGAKKIAAIVIAVVVIAVVGLFAFAAMNSPIGKVMFSTTAYDQGKQTCRFDSPITTASSSDKLFLIAAFHDKLAANQTFTLEVFKDGVSQGSNTGSIANEFQCYIEEAALGPFPPGVWKFVFTYNGKVEAEGTITIK